jgi:protein O-GlcNAc transferase
MDIESEFITAFQHHQAGRLNEAEQTYRRLLAADPSHADTLHFLGLLLFQRGQHADALVLMERAIALNGDNLAYHNNLGNVLIEQGKLDEAVACYRRALQLMPEDPTIQSNLGTVLQLAGKLDEAALCFERALRRNPDAVTHFKLGNVLQVAGKLEEAIASYRRALELTPEDLDIYANIGNICRLQGKLTESAFWHSRALELNPASAEPYNNLGTVLQDQGKLDDAIACYRRALELKPDRAAVRSNLLAALQYDAHITLAELAASQAEFERVHAAPLRAEWRPMKIDFDPERPLTLGFISPSFSQHPVGHFVVRALENLDREQFRVVCYSDRVGGDDWTNRFKNASAIWRETSAMTHAQMADQIRADRVDILFELAGHTANNRLLVGARKPAPIQITWADYVGTTGLTAIDYLLADRFEVPPEAETFYREQVLRMPHGYACYDPPPYAPPISPLPAIQQGFVTFSSFNYRPKISFETIDVWAKVLQRAARSRLVLKNRGIQDASVADPLRSEFARRGVEPNRIECLGWSAHPQLLAEYQRIDLALDTFPYNGGLTTCEAMWMGVPVITCPGETFASRHSLSHLSNAGLTETIAGNLDEYVDLAVSLATDLPRLALLRSTLRGRMAASPLCDAKRFAEDLMRILRDIWRQRCEKE